MAGDHLDENPEPPIGALLRRTKKQELFICCVDVNGLNKPSYYYLTTRKRAEEVIQTIAGASCIRVEVEDEVEMSEDDISTYIYKVYPLGYDKPLQAREARVSGRTGK